MPSTSLRVAVVTGHHPFDVVGFHQALRALPETDCYAQDLTDFASAPPEVRRGYDAVVFYNMHTALPGEDPSWFEAGIGPVIDQLGESDQGIIILHHALLAFPESAVWSGLVGIGQRTLSSYHPDQTLRIDVADRAHPITVGLDSWTIVDETYAMAEPDEEGNRVLLTTKHSPSMRAIAWTRRFRNARVLCYQSGHDNRVYADPGFRTVLGRGIRWCAGAL